MISSIPAQSGLSSAQRRVLKGHAHNLQPSVHVGKGGVEEAVIRAVDQALFDHELIKVKVLESAPHGRKEIAEKLSEGSSAHLVSVIGRVVILYKRHPTTPVLEI